jgi:hypothetical protein
MSSDTTSNIVKTAIARLLAYVDDAGHSIGDYVGTGASARIFANLAPDNVAYPYIVLRKFNSETSPEYGNLRQEYDLDVRCYGRPRGAKEQETELIADLVEGALLTWQESSTTLGLTYSHKSSRDTSEPDADPPDRDIVTVAVVVRCASWPKYVTNALT